MNITEAHDVQALLDFTANLTLWEGAAPVDEALIRGAVQRLADRSHKALGAGIRGDETGRVCDRLFSGERQ